MDQARFERNVFINCPFDVEYGILLKPLLYTVVKLGLTPRIASERLDSGEVRLDKIVGLILESRYGIHDLSRCKSSKGGEYYRLNMPFELAIDYSARTFHPNELMKQKVFLILEEEKYSLQKSLSDLSFSDTESHKGQPEEMVYKVRNWFYRTGMRGIESSSSIWDSYNYFYTNLFKKKAKEGFTETDVERLPVVEFLDEIREWIKK